MKEITMDYSEYEEMIKLIEAQKDAIKEIEKDSRVILIDRRNERSWWMGIFVPKILGDKDIAKEYLQQEFNDLSEQYNLMLERLDRSEEKNNKPKHKWFF